MSVEPVHPTRPVYRGILLLVLAMPPLALAVYAIAGWAAAIAACGLYLTALGLTVLAERRDAEPSRDPGTGLPDRVAALTKLTEIQGQRLVASSQAAVVVVSISAICGDTAGLPEDQADIFLVAARLAQGLRKGDQIMRAADGSLIAILGPSRGLTARAAESILARIEAMFRGPLRVGPASLEMRVSVGACLQHDAPRADAASWLEAAELAALVAAETGVPALFPSGATEVTRSAWILPDTEDAAEGARWRAVADAAETHRNAIQRRSA